MKEKVVSVTLCMLLLTVLCFAGTCDRANEVVNTMKPQVYQLIKDKGYDTNREIANEYMSNKASYDQLAKQNLW